jgi:hypothetical protein
VPDLDRRETDAKQTLKRQISSQMRLVRSVADGPEGVAKTMIDAIRLGAFIHSDQVAKLKWRVYF